MIFVKGISCRIFSKEVLGVSCVRKSTNWKLVALLFNLTFPLLKQAKPEEFLLMIFGLHGLLQYLRCGVNPWIFNLTFCLSKGNTVNRILCSSYIAVFLWLALLFHFNCLHNLGISIWTFNDYLNSIFIFFQFINTCQLF